MDQTKLRRVMVLVAHAPRSTHIAVLMGCLVLASSCELEQYSVLLNTFARPALLAGAIAHWSQCPRVAAIHVIHSDADPTWPPPARPTSEQARSTSSDDAVDDRLSVAAALRSLFAWAAASAAAALSSSTRPSTALPPASWGLPPVVHDVFAGDSLNNRFAPHVRRAAGGDGDGDGDGGDPPRRRRGGGGRAPHHRFGTAALLSVDDDVRIACPDVEAAFELWRADARGRGALVGWFPRLARVAGRRKMMMRR